MQTALAVAFIAVVPFGLCAWVGFQLGRGPKAQQDCFHHSRKGFSYVTKDGEYGHGRQVFTCRRDYGGCGKKWVK